MEINTEKYKQFLIENGIYNMSYEKDVDDIYTNITHICLDLVLSINRNYYNFVVPRIKSFQNNFSDIDTLSKLAQMIDSLGEQNFCEVWNYAHLERVRILHQVCTSLGKICSEMSEYTLNSSEILLLRKWATDLDLKNNDLIKIKGIGIASVQYLRILLGIDTVKPDIHIKKSIKNIYDKNLSDTATIKFIEKVSMEMGLNTRMIDAFVWNLFSSRSKNEIIWENGEWVRR